MKRFLSYFLFTLLLCFAVNMYAQTEEFSAARYINAGSVSGFAIDLDGYLWGWGGNHSGQLGNGQTSAENPLPRLIGNDKWKMLASRGNSVLAIREDGTLWSWGNNASGQLGQGSTTNILVPTQVGTDNDWMYVTVSTGNTSFAIKEDGTLWSCGKNHVGELGRGEMGEDVVYTTFEQIGTHKWKSVAGGNMHTIGVQEDGSLWACGGMDYANRYYGQLGLGTIESAPEFERVARSNEWEKVEATSNQSFGIRKDGTLWGWGNNTEGQLGLGTTSNVNTPLPIGEDEDWVKVVAATLYTLGVKKDGTLWSWGGSQYNVCLGYPTETPYILVPTRIGTDNDWVDASLTYQFAMGLKKNGNVYTWGCNDFGQLGNGEVIELGIDNGVVEPTMIGTGVKVNIKENKLTGNIVKIYPNPVVGSLTIEPGESKIYKVKVYNSLGALLVETGEASIDFSGFANGIYLLEVDTNDGTENIKVVKR